MSITIDRPRTADSEPDGEEDHVLAGWYPALDPWRDRYWNGTAWTERYRDRGIASELPPQPSPSGRPVEQQRSGVAAWVVALGTAAALVTGVLLGGAASVVGIARAGTAVIAATAQAAQAEARADALQERVDVLEAALRDEVFGAVR